MNNIRNMIFIAGALCALAFGTSSCGLYGKYKPQNEEAVDTLKVPSYRDIFCEKPLLDLIDTAIANNLDLKMAHERVNQAKYKLKIARMAYYPRLFAGSSQLGTFSPQNGFQWNEIASATWQIDIFGRVINQNRMAKKAKEEAEAFEQAARVELVGAVANLYYTLQMLDAEVLVAEAAVVTWAKSVETMKALKVSGQTDEAAVKQFEGSMFNTSSQVKALKLLRHETENSLRLLLCKEDYKIERLPLVTGEAKINVLLLSEIDLRAVRVRPDVKQAEMQLAQSFYNVNYARANCCPDLTIGASLGYSQGFIYGLVGGLLQPVFNGGQNILAVKVNKSVYEQARMNYANVLLSAATDVSNALAAQEIHTAQILDFAGRVNAMETALDITQTKMKYGRGTYLEVLTAQNDLLSARLAQIKNFGDILTSGVDIYRSLGGGRE